MTDPTTRCCGRAENYPVYINTELQGCFTPLIPGYKNSEDDDFYGCYDVPDALLGPPSVLPQEDFDSADVITTGPALDRPLVITSSNSKVYYLNGCYGRQALDLVDNVLGVLNALFSATYTDIQPATLQNCADLCNGGINAYDVIAMVNGR